MGTKLSSIGNGKWHCYTLVRKTVTEEARAGFTPSRAPVQRKMWGPYYMNAPPRLPSPDTHSSHHRHFVEGPCCNAHYYCSSSCLAV